LSLLAPTQRKEPFCRITGHTSEEVREIRLCCKKSEGTRWA
jgi:hypothetical protein